MAILGKPLDDEDLIEKILNGLNPEYKSVVDGVNARDTLISFNELFEKLINKEVSVESTSTSHALNIPITAMAATPQSRGPKPPCTQTSTGF